MQLLKAAKCFSTPNERRGSPPQNGEPLHTRHHRKKERWRMPDRRLVITLALFGLVGVSNQADTTCDPGYYLLSGTCTVCPAGKIRLSNFL